MLKLNKISLDGYKSIKECHDLRLEKLNVLIGANGSGKSNFLSFFKLLNFEMSGALQEFIGRNGGRESFLHMGAKVTNHIWAKLEMTTETETSIYRMRLTDAQPDTLIFTEESLQTQTNGTIAPTSKEFASPAAPFVKGEQLKEDDIKERGFSSASVHRESILLSPEWAANEAAKFLRKTLGHFRFYHFHDSTDRSRMRSRSDLSTSQHLHHDGGNVAACLHLLRERQPDCYNRVVEVVRLVFPCFRDFILEPEAGDYVMLRWKAVGSAEYEFGPHQISDGTLRFIALATLLLQPHDWLPSLIAIDEPELGLHPCAIKILASLIQDAANFTQIIVATQSAALVDQVDPDDVIVADLVDGATKFERQSREKLKEWLEDYTLSQLWETNAIGGRP
jgi:predicted ATPase